MKIDVKGVGQLDVPDNFKELPAGAQQKMIANLVEQKQAGDTNTMSEASAAARFGLGQGLALGFGDEIEAAMRSAFSDKTYKEERDRIRAEMDNYRKANSGKALAYELGGGLLTGGIGAGRAALAKGAGALMQGLKTGAATGAVAGAGAADEMSDIPANAVFGAVAGGTLGAAMPAAINTVGRLGRGVKDTLNMTSAKSAQKRSDLKILEALEKEGMNPTQALSKLAELKRMGVADSVLADVTGEAGRKLGRGSVSISSDARRAAEALEERQMASAGRITDDSMDVLAGNKDAFDTLGTIQKNRSDNAQADYAAALFDEAGDRMATVTPEMRRLFDLDAFDEAIDKAASIAKLEGKTVMSAKQLKAALDDKKNPLTTLPMEQLHYIKLGVDAVLDMGKKGTSKTSISKMEDRLLKGKRQDFLKMLDTASPEYAVARNNFAGDIAMEEALDVGMNIFRAQGKSQMLRKAVDEMTDSERDAFRIGVAQAINERTSGLVDKANTAANIFKNPETRDRLKIAFGDDFDDFSKRIGAMRNQEETRAFMNVGSRTEPMGRDATAAMQDAGILLNLARGNVIGAGQQAVTRMGGMPEKIGGNIGRDMFDTNLANQRRTLARLRKLAESEAKRQRGSSAVGGLLGGTGGSYSGLLLGD